MRKLDCIVWAGALALVGVGCSSQSPDAKEGDDRWPMHTGETGMALRAGVSIDADVDLVRYTIERVECFAGEEFAPLTERADARLEDLSLPGGIPEFENKPLDENSNHRFSDHFAVLPAGCYDVRAEPMLKGVLSTECASAWANGVAVEDGMTTEVMLISQCKGDPVGALDSVVAFNQPPELGDLEYSPSKFIPAGSAATVCATASDANNDPIQFVWTEQMEGACYGPTLVSNTTNSDGSITECVKIQPLEAGGYWFEVRMYDLAHDETGKLIRIEDWLRKAGYPNDSHDSLRFPLYALETSQ